MRRAAGIRQNTARLCGHRRRLGARRTRPHFLFHGERAVDPARFHATARLLLQKGAELTPRAAVALGDREAVLRLHREGRLPNEIQMFRGGLLAIAVRVNRLDMVATLLDLGLDPDESWSATTAA